LEHPGESLRRRLTDFPTTDREKPARHLGEFLGDITHGAEGRAQAIMAWNAGFAALERTLEQLPDADLERTVTIRPEPHSVPLALACALAHISYHVGQIVFTSRLLTAGESKTLTIPGGGSDAIREAMAATWKQPTSGQPAGAWYATPCEPGATPLH
jgi:hypothetical protein